MTDPENQRRRAERAARRGELLHQLERAERDPEAIVTELRALDEADEQYARLLKKNEVDTDIALRAAGVPVPYDSMRAMLEEIPPGSPFRDPLARMLDSLASGKGASDDDLAALSAAGMPAALVTQMRELEAERRALEAIQESIQERIQRSQEKGSDS